jgi:hypothetical protein
VIPGPTRPHGPAPPRPAPRPCPGTPAASSQFKNNHLTEMRSGSEAGSHRLLYHSTLGSRVIKNKAVGEEGADGRELREVIPGPTRPHGPAPPRPAPRPCPGTPAPPARPGSLLGGKLCSLIRKHNQFTSTREIKRHVGTPAPPARPGPLF